MSARKIRRAAAPQDDTARSASQAQIDANRTNAKLSTGPTSGAGKTISSQKRRSHGLAGAFQILPWEDANAFLDMRNELRQHYRPVGIIEQGYVNRLAEHSWLRQRSLVLQLNCFDPACDLKYINDEKQFALLIRYQNQNEHAMDRCVNMLTKFQTARRQEQIGFESEIRQEAAETRNKETHEARLRLINARAKAIEVKFDIRQTMEARSMAPNSLPPVSSSHEIKGKEVAA